MMAESSEKEFDLVVFGATGFTGKYMVAEVARIGIEDPSMRWAVAGRNESKLRKALDDVAKKHIISHPGFTLSYIKKIIANVDEEASLIAMAAQTRVVINCVGPYAFYGEQVVKACIKMKASHVDISGEPMFLEKMQLKYNDKAREAGVYIVGSCGFDSVPSDLGVLYTARQFAGDLNSVQGYFKTTSTMSGTSANYGTFASAVNGFRDQSKRLEQTKLLFPQPIPQPSHRLTKRSPIFYSDDANVWCHDFPGCDRSVVRRTQYQLYNERQHRPIQFAVYLGYSSLITCLLTVVTFLFFTFMCQWRFTRWILLWFPGMCTGGIFSREGPTMEKIASTSFSLTLVGDGYETKIENPNTPHREEPNSRVVTRISGPEMGYITTPICAVQAAVVILRESNLLPKGGVYTPGGAFSETTIIERLEKRGVTFSIVELQHRKTPRPT